MTRIVGSNAPFLHALKDVTDWETLIVILGHSRITIFVIERRNRYTNRKSSSTLFNRKTCFASRKYHIDNKLVRTLEIIYACPPPNGSVLQPSFYLP